MYVCVTQTHIHWNDSVVLYPLLTFPPLLVVASLLGERGFRNDCSSEKGMTPDYYCIRMNDLCRDSVSPCTTTVLYLEV
jgi:hypothetical protein